LYSCNSGSDIDAVKKLLKVKSFFKEDNLGSIRICNDIGEFITIIYWIFHNLFDVALQLLNVFLGIEKGATRFAAPWN
jgi:hypothetical protein